MKQRNLLPILLLLFAVFSSCIKDIEDTNVPEVRVSLSINLSLAECVPLRPGNYTNGVSLETINSYFSNMGYNGIMVIQSLDGSYYAYDQCCTNNPNEKHKLIPEGAIATCQECNSVFILDILGSYSSGPAPQNYNLRKYNARLLRSGGDYYLRISN